MWPKLNKVQHTENEKLNLRKQAVGRVFGPRIYYREEKFVYYGVLDLFPLTSMCVESDFGLFCDKKAENIHLKHKKRIMS